MFGSGHMEAYGAIEAAIERIHSASYLSPKQKRAILYDNAARFLRLSEEEVARHHAMVSRQVDTVRTTRGGCSGIGFQEPPPAAKRTPVVAPVLEKMRAPPLA